MGDLSILIPVYRYDCTQLVADLHTQGDALGIDYEVIVADDEKLGFGMASSFTQSPFFINERAMPDRRRA